MPLWCYKPELEQDSRDWHTAGPRILANRLKRFLDARTLHDQFLYRKLWQDTLHRALNCRTPDWKEVLPHLLGVELYQKFSQNNYLRIRLQETGDQPLVYVDETNPLLGGVFTGGAFRGENLYGKALIQVRSQLNRIYDNVILCLGVQEEISEDVYGESFDMPF